MDSQEIEMKTYIAILAGAMLTSTTFAGDAGTAGKVPDVTATWWNYTSATGIIRGSIAINLVLGLCAPN